MSNDVALTQSSASIPAPYVPGPAGSQKEQPPAPPQDKVVTGEPQAAPLPTRQEMVAMTGAAPAVLENRAPRTEAVNKIIGGDTAPLPKCTYVIFGATGDLVQNHAVRDALVHLASNDILAPDNNPVWLLSGKPIPHQTYLTDFRKGAQDSPAISDEQFGKFEALVSQSRQEDGNLMTGNLGEVADFKKVADKLGPNGNAVLYFAVPAKLEMKALQRVKESGLDKGADGTFRRIVLEKPFGSDPAQADELADYIQQNFQRGQVLLVDHFLGKPGTLNWLSAKTDPDIGGLLNNKFVDRVDVILDEKDIASHRDYYRNTGQLRDMAQNHAMSLLSTVLGSLGDPSKLDGHHVRSARIDILDHMSINPHSIQRAQVAEFNDPAHGAPLGDDGQVKESRAETFAAFQVNVDTPRWKGVPVNVRAMKGAHEKRYAVDVHVTGLTNGLAQRLGVDADSASSTGAVISFEMYPQTRVAVKLDGDKQVHTIAADDRLKAWPGYSRLMTDAIRGNNALFVDKSESIASWHRVMAPIQDKWAKDDKMLTYPMGTNAWEVGVPMPLNSAETIGAHISLVQALAALYPLPMEEPTVTQKPAVPFKRTIEAEAEFRAQRIVRDNVALMEKAGTNTTEALRQHGDGGAPFERDVAQEKARLLQRLTDIQNQVPVQRAPLGSHSQQMGMIGVGVMGKGFAINQAEHGTSMAVFDEYAPTLDKVEQEFATLPHLDLLVARDVKQFVDSLQQPRIVALLGRDGPNVDKVLDKVLPYLEKGDVIVEMANSDVYDSEKRAVRVQAKGVDFVPMGISGGERGARNGPGMMIGGSDESYLKIGRYYEAPAPVNEVDGDVGVVHSGNGPAGQFVKMVHNGIEYAELQLLAETYDIFKRGGMDSEKIANVFDNWANTDANSFLLKTAATVLHKTDLETGNSIVDLIRDKTAQKGTGRRTQEASLQFGAVTPGIDAAVETRSLTYYKKDRVALSSQLEGPSARPIDAQDEDTLVAQARNNYQAGKILAFVQGFHLLKLANEQFHLDAEGNPRKIMVPSAEDATKLVPGPNAEPLNIDLARAARGWRNGTIVEGDLISKLAGSLQGGDANTLSNLLYAPDVQKDLAVLQNSMRFISTYAQANGVPTPTTDANRSYYDSYRSAKLPGNLVAAERDYFGSHQYWREDKPDDVVFHQPTWLNDGVAEKSARK